MDDENRPTTGSDGEAAEQPRRPLLGLRVAQRRSALSGAGGRRLAHAVEQRHEPLLGGSATRLAKVRLQRRGAGAASAPAAAPAGPAISGPEPAAYQPSEPSYVDPANEA